mgnify:CR=1 FL=1
MGYPSQGSAKFNENVMLTRLVESGLAESDASTLDIEGMFQGITSTGGAVPTIDANGTFVRSTSGGVSGDDTGLSSELTTRRAHNPKFEIKFKFAEITTVRRWIVLTDLTLATQVASDSPAGSFAGIRLSTDASDTNFRFTCKDGTTLNNQDSGIAVDTAVHYLRIEFDDTAGTVTLVLFNSSHTEQARVTLTANLPAAGTNLRIVSACETRDAVARTVDNYGMAIFKRSSI